MPSEKKGKTPVKPTGWGLCAEGNLSINNNVAKRTHRRTTPVPVFTHTANHSTSASPEVSCSSSKLKQTRICLLTTMWLHTVRKAVEKLNIWIENTGKELM